MDANPPASAPVAGERLFFVYGTLRQGDDNDITRLQPPPRYLGQARIPGVMYHLGAYPGVRLGLAGAACGWVVGEVYAVSPALEAQLDAIEAEYPAQADEYAKREITLQLSAPKPSAAQPSAPAQHSPSLRCAVYEINASYTVGKPVIASGDWVKDRHLGAAQGNGDQVLG
jgi:gamma-glutamylcyclotransferase (GGCT)/AIG2-like uncharacterized protein YtfP